MSKTKANTLTTTEFGWIFQAAGDHFVEQLAKAELQLARCQIPQLSAVPLCRAVNIREDRAETVATLTARIDQYYRILEFCKQLREAQITDEGNFAKALSVLSKMV